MPLEVACPSCRNILKAPDHLAGRQAKCAACGGIVVVAEISIPDALPVKARQPRREKPAQPEPPHVKKSELEEDAAEWAIPLEEEPEALLEEIVPSRPTVAARKPTRKKRRKRSAPRDAEASNRAWIWWAGGAGLLFAALAGLVIWAIQAGYMAEVIADGIYVAVMLPVSLVLLVISMLIANSFAGGIDFGEIHIAIPKALLLLFVINLIHLLPMWIGFIIAYPVFLFGLMIAFRLDLWEAGFISFVNNTLYRLILIFILTRFISGGSSPGLQPSGPFPDMPRGMPKGSVGPFDHAPADESPNE